jgi:ribosomal protein S8E
MPQNEYIEEAIKKHGRRLDHGERKWVDDKATLSNLVGR